MSGAEPWFIGTDGEPGGTVHVLYLDGDDRDTQFWDYAIEACSATVDQDGNRACSPADPVSPGATWTVGTYQEDAAGHVTPWGERSAQLFVDFVSSPHTVTITSPADGATIAGTAVVLRGTGAWLVFSALPAEGGYLMQFTRDLFAATTLEALSTLIVGLLPLAFVDGGAIFAWSKRAWLATYVAAVFAFVVIVLPMGDSWGEISAPLLGWVAMFAGFAVVAVGVWAYFRFVPEKSREEVGAGAR